MVKLIIGGLLATFGALVLVVAIGMWVDPVANQKPGDVPIIATFAFFFMIPGVLLFRSGRQEGRTTARREELIGYARTHRRISLTTAAADLGATANELKRDVTALNGLGRLELMFVPETNEYLTRRDYEQRRSLQGAKCSSCGAGVPGDFALTGETVSCSFCKAPIFGVGTLAS
jgi:hypothetical protein